MGTFDGGGDGGGRMAAERAERQNQAMFREMVAQKKQKGGGDEDHLPATVVEAGNGTGGVSSSSLWRLGLPWKGRRETAKASTEHGVVFSVVVVAVWDSRRRWGWPALALLGSHVQASLPAEDYWHTLWPDTPMPKPLKDLLVQPDWITRRTGAFVKQQATTSSKVKVPNGMFFFDLYDDHNKDSDYIIDKTFPFYYIHYKKSDDLMDNKLMVSNGTFFFEHYLLPGKKLILGPINPSDEFTFLPEKIAKTIPFFSIRLLEISNRLNIEADSTDAKSMKKTLSLCEAPAIKGEDKYCATSLESLLDFAVSQLGRNIRLLFTEFERETQDRQYRVAAEGAKKIGEKEMVCHKLDYPYAVFYCHKIKTRSYSVPLVARNDGTNVKAIPVCHTDTSHWTLDHIAFKMLNTKPEISSICHFLSTDTVIWVLQFSTDKDDL
ncbi:hypothetical protein PIB30_069457 [Stylosanthes scabra]|uniref:BURP domain-containing protein n=1 Tax=Stylosanthes scabra TaxID=79078 RepID=A0ABU6RNE9_9FABA|nr:hypothetical protein [Stylosanthes scabra]